MDKLPKHTSADVRIIKEFVPRDKTLERSAGCMIVRSENYGGSLTRFDKFFKVLAADALALEPPIELDRDDVEIIHYAGDRYKGTYGMEVSIPEGHSVPEDYTRRSEV